jgi:phosphatidylglycerophosphate synthase
MTAQKKTATLVLAGSGTASAGSLSAESALLGLPLVRRTTLAALRAGFDRVYVLAAEAGPASTVLEGTGARVFPRDAAASALPPGRIVLLPDRVVASPQWLASLRDAPVEPGRLHRLGAGAIVQTEDPAPLDRALARQSRLSSVISEWAAVLPPGPSVASVALPLEVTTESELAAAETLLLKGLVKKEDGILTRLISRKISLAVTRRLAGTRITPNVMTFVTAALGLAAAWSFASPALPRQIAGGLLFLLHSILDGCDGELARLKFQESRLGGTLDFWGDNVVHVAVFSAFAIAWSAACGQSWPLVLGAMAVSGTVLGAGYIYMYAMRPRPAAGPLLTTVSPSHRSRLTEVLDAVARRDFIYIVMVLALFGKGYWFLAAASVGTPGFFLALLFVALTSRLNSAARTRSRSGQSSPESAR